MDERIQRALDGELPRSALTAAETAALPDAEDRIATVLRAVRSRALPDLAPTVMARIDDAAAARSRDTATAPRRRRARRPRPRHRPARRRRRPASMPRSPRRPAPAFPRS